MKYKFDMKTRLNDFYTNIILSLTGLSYVNILEVFGFKCA